MYILEFVRVRHLTLRLSESKMIIWEEFDNFRDLSNKLADDTFSAVKNLSDVDDLKPALKTIALGCKGCHSRYRE